MALQTKIYENDVLVHDFIPALYGSDVPCVYDTIAQEYKYNAGSSSFIYGQAEEIYATYLKVSGAWQDLIGTGIDDVNTGN